MKQLFSDVWAIGNSGPFCLRERKQDEPYYLPGFLPKGGFQSEVGGRGTQKKTSDLTEKTVLLS